MPNELRKETEKAWNLPPGRLTEIWQWVQENVPKERRGIALVSILRQIKERDNRVKKG